MVLARLRRFFHATFIRDGVLQSIKRDFIQKRCASDGCWRKAWAAARDIFGSEARALDWIRSSCRASVRKHTATSSAPAPALPPPPPPLYRGFKEEERTVLMELLPVSDLVTVGWYRDKREQMPAFFENLEKSHGGERRLLEKIRGLTKHKPKNIRKTLAPEIKNYFREHSDLLGSKGLDNRPEIFLHNLDQGPNFRTIHIQLTRVYSLKTRVKYYSL